MAESTHSKSSLNRLEDAIAKLTTTQLIFAATQAFVVSKLDDFILKMNTLETSQHSSSSSTAISSSRKLLRDGKA